MTWAVQAAAIYRSLHGHLRIPRSYVVPSEAPWPASMRGLPLGNTFSTLRSIRATYEPQQFAKLEALGFDWSLGEGQQRVLIHNESRDRRLRNVPLTTLVKTLQTYHSTYSDLNIPKAFGVPVQDAAWSPDAANVALFYVPQTLRALFYELSDQDVTVLHGLGLFPDLPPWADARLLLSTFKNIVQTNTVPLDFAVPATLDWPTQYHGFGLGELAWYVGLKSATLPRDKRDQLRALQFDFNTPAMWAGIVRRLEAGDADVPAEDGVPNDGVPQLRFDRWTSKLQQAQSLYQLPRATLDAVSAMDARNPTVMVSTAATVPAPLGSATPSKRRASPTHDSECGKRARVGGELDEVIRTGPSTRYKKATLRELGVDGATSSGDATDSPPPGPSPVVFDDEFTSDDDDCTASASSSSYDDESTTSASSSSDDDTPFVDRAADKKQRRTWTWENKIDALNVYRTEHGHVDVPRSYRVPASSAYQKGLHGMALGKIVSHIRTGGILMTPARLRDLDALGFRWRCDRMGYKYPCKTRSTRRSHQLRQFVSWPDQIEALLTYRRLHGDLNVPDDFFAPSTDEWPSAMHNVELKCVLPVLRKHIYELPGHYTDRVHGPASGLVPDIPDFDTFVRLVEIYNDAVGNGAVARDFVVPPNGGNWIDAWRGLCLGDLAWSVGLNMNALTPHKRAHLATAGFVFTEAATWRRIVLGLRTFFSVHGRATVPAAYVVPSAPEWPVDLHGMRLGHWVDVMKLARKYRLLPTATVAAIDAIGMGGEDNGALLPPSMTSGRHGARPAPPTCSSAAGTTAAAPVRATSPSPPVVMLPDIDPHDDDDIGALDPSAPVVPSGCSHGDSVAQARIEATPAVDSSDPPPGSSTAAVFSTGQEAPLSDSLGARALVGAPPPASGVTFPAAGKDGDSDDDNLDVDAIDDEEPDQEADASLEPSTPLAAASGSRDQSAAPTPTHTNTVPLAVVDSSVPPPHLSAATIPVHLPLCQAPLPMNAVSAHEPAVGASPASRIESTELETRVDAQWLMALETFKAVYHHLDVPPDFVIEAMEPWPASVYGLQLGNVVVSLRLRTPSVVEPWIVARLDALGFEWAPLRFDLVDAAMQHLVAEFPVHPPASFVVPAEPPWPHDLWGVDLLQLSAKRDEWLEEMEMQYEASLALFRVPSIEPPAVTSKRVYPVQLVLQCIGTYGQASIPLLFHVPPRDDKWPAGASLMPLGFFVWAARDQWANLDLFVRRAISAFRLSPDDGMDVGAALNDDAIGDDDQRHAVRAAINLSDDSAGPVIIDLTDDSAVVIDLSNDASDEDDQADDHSAMMAAPAAVFV